MFHGEIFKSTATAPRLACLRLWLVNKVYYVSLLLVFATIFIIYFTTNEWAATTVVFVETQDEGIKYCDSYTQSQSQFNLFRGFGLIIEASGMKRTKTSFAIRHRFNEFNILNVASIHALLSENRIERKKSKYFKCSYQVFPVHQIGFKKSLSTLA